MDLTQAVETVRRATPAIRDGSMTEEEDASLTADLEALLPSLDERGQARMRVYLALLEAEWLEASGHAPPLHPLAGEAERLMEAALQPREDRGEWLEELNRARGEISGLVDHAPESLRRSIILNLHVVNWQAYQLQHEAGEVFY